MRAHQVLVGAWVFTVGVVIAVAGGCSSDSSNGFGAGRTQTKIPRPAEITNGHVSVLPSSAEGGGALACPADYKTCGDGGCCPEAGACTDGFTCEVAPTTCSACTTSATSGRCCEGNCCPSGSACSNGLCRTKRAEAPVECGSSAITPCGSGCCPAGASCNGEVCEIHAGVPPKCAEGATLCDNGTCCPAGYSCSDPTTSSSRCEKDPAPPAVGSVSGTCPAGDELLLPAGSNCPPVTASNAPYLGAMCCPKGSIVHCQSASLFDPQPTCLIAPTDRTGLSCPSGTLAVSSTTDDKCCPYIDSYPYFSDIDGDGTADCYYQSTSAPTCSPGAIDPGTGKCCTGSSAGSGGCCPSGTSSCGTGCCNSGDSCSAGKCTSYSTTSPTCPTEAARRCPQSDGSNTCCPLDTTCGPNGTCSCPLSAKVDCGGFCATDSAACGCPSDHPDLCGGTCCLSGGCNQLGGSSQVGSCRCPSSASSCGDLCCPSGTTCGSSQGLSGCFKCPDDAPTLCGKNCCASDEECVDGECVACPAAAPVVCGKTCCNTNELCSGGVCKSRNLGAAGNGSGGGDSVTIGGSGASGNGGVTCSSFVSACAGCSYRVCVSQAGSASCRTYYEKSDGSRYNCVACGDCSGAAQSVVQGCCEGTL